MDEWLIDRFSGDGRAMRQSGREYWRAGWTMVAVGVVPLLFLWGISGAPSKSVLVGIPKSLPQWVPAVAPILAYLGLVSAVCGWYLARLGKRFQNYL